MDSVGVRVRNGFNEIRSPDVMVINDPFYLGGVGGTNHGTPFSYDTHVPVIFFGPGVKPGQYHFRIMVNDIAPTLATLLDDGTALSFVDQRTFGGWMLADLVTVDGSEVPEPVAHIARDPLDPLFDRDAVVKVLRRKHSEIKRQLLDQTVVSGDADAVAEVAAGFAASGRRTRELTVSHAFHSAHVDGLLDALHPAGDRVR